MFNISINNILEINGFYMSKDMNEKLLSFEDTESQNNDLENLNKLTKFNYYPKDKEELLELVNELIEERGSDADLNDIYTGDITDMSFLFSMSTFNGDISKWDVSHVKDMGGMFRFCYGYEKGFNIDISNWDVSNVENMNGMFYHSSFNSDISKWDVHNVKNMSSMFGGNRDFNTDISKWDVSNVEDMSYMFAAAIFNNDISNWNVSNVKYMIATFYASNFNGDISKWDVSNVEDMESMFGSSKFNGDISNWNVSNVKNMKYIFQNSNFDGDISKWVLQKKCNITDANFPVKPKIIQVMNEKLLSFEDVESEDKDIENLNKVSKIAANKNEFERFWYYEYDKEADFWRNDHEYPYRVIGCDDYDKTLNTYTLIKNDGSYEIQKQWAFDKIESPKRADVYRGDNGHLLVQWCSPHHKHMLVNCLDYKNNKLISPYIWFRNVIRCFTGNRKRELYEGVSPFLLDKEKVDKYFKEDWWFSPHAVGRASIMPNIRFDKDGNIYSVLGNPFGSEFNLNDPDIADKLAKEFNINRANIEKPKGLTEKLLSFEDAETKDNDLENLNELTKFTYFPKMRDELKDLVDKLRKERGNKADLNDIYTGDITDMYSLFTSTDFNGDISKWDVSKVKNMSSMFANSKFNGDISNWNVSNVKDMDSMFYRSKFKGDISKWDVSNVKYMSYMFFSSSFNGDISKWDVSNVESMYGIFYDSKFKGDVSKWNINPKCNIAHANFPNKEMNEKLLSFEDVESEDNDLENLNKVSEIAERKKWFEENCIYDKEYYSGKNDISNCKFILVGKKDLNGNPSGEENFLINDGSYKFLCPFWFDSATSNFINKSGYKNSAIIRIYCKSKEDADNNEIVKGKYLDNTKFPGYLYNVLNSDGTLKSPYLWASSIIPFSYIQLNPNKGKQEEFYKFSFILKKNGDDYRSQIDFVTVGGESLNYLAFWDEQTTYEYSFLYNDSKNIKKENELKDKLRGNSTPIDITKKTVKAKTEKFINKLFDKLNALRSYNKTYESQSVNEKLLSFEDVDSKDNDLENLNKVSEIEANRKWAEEYCVIHKDKLYYDEWYACQLKEDKKWVIEDNFKITYPNSDVAVNTAHVTNSLQYVNFVNKNTYELLSPYLWFDWASAVIKEFYTDFNGDEQLLFMFIKYGIVYWISDKGEIFTVGYNPEIGGQGRPVWKNNYKGSYISNITNTYLNIHDKNIQDKLTLYYINNFHHPEQDRVTALEEKLLSFEDVDSEDNDLENLSKVNKLAEIEKRRKWIEDNYNILDPWNSSEKSYNGEFPDQRPLRCICTIGKPTTMYNFIYLDTYELLSPNLWFDDTYDFRFCHSDHRYRHVPVFNIEKGGWNIIDDEGRILCDKWYKYLVDWDCYFSDLCIFSDVSTDLDQEEANKIYVNALSLIKKARNINEKLLSFEDKDSKDNDLENLTEVSNTVARKKWFEENCHYVYDYSFDESSPLRAIALNSNDNTFNKKYNYMFNDGSYRIVFDEWLRAAKDMVGYKSGKYAFGRFERNDGKWNYINQNGEVVSKDVWFDDIEVINYGAALFTSTNDSTLYGKVRIGNTQFLLNVETGDFHNIRNHKIIPKKEILGYAQAIDYFLQEKLLSFEDVESEDSDLENLNKISEFVERKKWFKKNCRFLDSVERNASADDNVYTPLFGMKNDNLNKEYLRICRDATEEDVEKGICFSQQQVLKNYLINDGSYRILFPDFWFFEVYCFTDKHKGFASVTRYSDAAIGLSRDNFVYKDGSFVSPKLWFDDTYFITTPPPEHMAAKITFKSLFSQAEEYKETIKEIEKYLDKPADAIMKAINISKYDKSYYIEGIITYNNKFIINELGYFGFDKKRHTFIKNDNIQPESVSVDLKDPNYVENLLKLILNLIQSN